MLGLRTHAHLPHIVLLLAHLGSSLRAAPSGSRARRGLARGRAATLRTSAARAECPCLAFWRARAADRAGTVHWAAAGRGLASSNSAVHLSALPTASCCGEARPEAVVLKGSGVTRAGARAGRVGGGHFTRARSHRRLTVRRRRPGTLWSSPPLLRVTRVPVTLSCVREGLNLVG